MKELVILTNCFLGSDFLFSRLFTAIVTIFTAHDVTALWFGVFWDKLDADRVTDVNLADLWSAMVLQATIESHPKEENVMNLKEVCRENKCGHKMFRDDKTATEIIFKND